MSKKFKQVIVLEDDCVPRLEFFPFILKSLKKFKNNLKVLGVCGYQLPELHKKKDIEIKAILFKNFISWGWAIWSKKWLKYIKDYRKYYKRSKNKSKISKVIEKKYANDKNYWTPNFIDYAFQTKSIFVFPNKSLVKNIGFDGTGVNSKTSFDFNTYYTKSKSLNINNKLMLNKNLNYKQERILLKKLHLFY